MSLLKFLILPVGILIVAVVYWWMSGYEWSGSIMLAFFAVAMGVMGWILVPTFDDVGPTAPVDPDWDERST